MCATLVLSRGKYDSAKQALFDLHWLPIKARINFKILTTMLLSESVNPRQGLRSGSDPGISYDIHVPFNTKTRFNDRSFCTIGPKLWNNLPLYKNQSVTIDVF